MEIFMITQTATSGRKDRRPPLSKTGGPVTALAGASFRRPTPHEVNSLALRIAAFNKYAAAETERNKNHPTNRRGWSAAHSLGLTAQWALDESRSRGGHSDLLDEAEGVLCDALALAQVLGKASAAKANEPYVVEWELPSDSVHVATHAKPCDSSIEEKIRAWASDPNCKDDAPIKKFVKIPKTPEARAMLWSKLYPDDD
jgi:hypothetical protein